MKFIPILFSTPMVQAILDGRKTQTRRVVKPQPNESGISYMKNPPLNWEQVYKTEWKPWKLETEEGETIALNCPYGNPGDILWVRETYYAYGWWVKNGKTKSGKQKWKFVDFTEIDTEGNYYYEDNKPEKIEKGRAERIMGWYKRPSLFMPKSACRIFLKITNVRVERLQDITEKDAKSEGIIDRGALGFTSFGIDQSEKATEAFKYLWGKINGEQSWNDNPFVWVIEFERIEKPENFI